MASAFWDDLRDDLDDSNFLAAYLEAAALITEADIAAFEAEVTNGAE